MASCVAETRPTLLVDGTGLGRSVPLPGPWRAAPGGGPHRAAPNLNDSGWITLRVNQPCAHLLILLRRTIRLTREGADLAAEVAAAEELQLLLLARASRPTPGYRVQNGIPPNAHGSWYAWKRPQWPTWCSFGQEDDIPVLSLALA